MKQTTNLIFTYFILLAVFLTATNVHAANDSVVPSISGSCVQIVKSPKVLNASQAECECVLSLMHEHMTEEVLVVQIEYLKEPDHKIRSNLEWDLMIKHGAHNVLAQTNKVNPLAIEQCGTDMRSTRLKRKESAASLTKSPATVDAKDSPVNSDATKKDSKNESSPEQLKEASAAAASKFSKDYSGFLQEEKFCTAIRDYATAQGKSVYPTPEQCSCFVANIESSLSTEGQVLFLTMIFGAPNDRTLAVEEILSPDSALSFGAMETLRKDFSATCDWNFDN